MATRWEPTAAAVRRVADVHLRGVAGPLRARLYWPAPTGVRPAVLVFFGAGARAADGAGGERTDTLCRELCAGVGLVVLSTLPRPVPDQPYPAAVRDATTVTEWVADHAAELDADPGRLLIAGQGSGAGLAAAVALHARDHGWPPIARQVLIHPRLDLPTLSLAGLAPATVVTGSDPPGGDGRQYAARLRRAGVEVEELRDSGPADPAGRTLVVIEPALRRAAEHGPGPPPTSLEPA